MSIEPQSINVKLGGIHDREGRHIAPSGGMVFRYFRLVKTMILGYNTGVNHIKSDGLLAQRRHPFSNRVRGTNTMSYSTRSPYFPANLEYFAPWVATHGLTTPYGQCQCGCGQDAPIAKKTYSDKGIRKGYPKRFIHGHNTIIPDDAPAQYKTCTMCGEAKPVTEFSKKLKNGDSLQSHCKSCCAAQSRAYHYANREKRLEKITEYRLAHKEELAAKERERRNDHHL